MGLGGLIEDFVGSLVQLEDAEARTIGCAFAGCRYQVFTTIQKALAESFRNDKVAVFLGNVKDNGSQIALRPRSDFELKQDRRA